MRPRTLLVLLVVVAALGAFIWFYERDLPSSDQRAELAKRVVRLEADEVSELLVVRGDERLRLERTAAAGGEDDAEAEWWLREPLTGRADGYEVDRLVEQLATLEKDRTLDDYDAAELGLAEPRARVTLTTGGGPVELLVGSRVPASSTMIVGVAGRQQAYVVADALWQQLTRPAGDWRNRDLGPSDRQSIQRATLTAGDRRLVLGRRGETFWVESPYSDRADKQAVDELLGALTGLRVEQFVDDPPADPAALGLEPPVAVVEVVLEGQEQALRVELGGPSEDDPELRLARVEGQIFETRSRLAAAAERPAADWRELSWSALEVYHIDRLTVTEAAGESVLTRDGGDWLRDGTAIDYGPVSDFLYALAGVEAEAVGGAPPAGEPVLTLELAGAGEDAPAETLRLHAPLADGRSPATVEGRDTVLLLPAGTVSDLQVKLEELRQAEPDRPADEADLEPAGGGA